MNLLVISDIHGRISSGRAISDIVKNDDIDHILCLGDFFNNGPRNEVPNDYNPKELVPIFLSFKDKMVAVQGNCDGRVDDMVLGLSLKLIKSVKIHNKVIYMTHGDVDGLYDFEPKNNEFLIKGHTHIPYMIHSKMGGIKLNPGSMSMPKGSLGRTFIEIRDDEIFLFEFSFEKELKILKKIKLDKEDYSFIK